MIATGTLKPGDQLPTVRHLALDLRINFNTVARAYRMLDEAGFISTQQGRGTYVLEQPPPADQKKLRRTKLQELTRRYLEEGRRLGYTPDEVHKQFENSLKDWMSARLG
jgi:GntR family transcriptional regulator